jgi:hypothetical protein
VTKAAPLPKAEVVRCRDALAGRLREERGVTEEVDPMAFALGLLVREQLSPSQAEVARQIVWLDSIVLQTRGTGAEERAQGVSTAIIALTDTPGWHEVETPPSTPEEERLTKEEHRLGNELAAMIRPIQNQMVTVLDQLQRFCDVARRRGEMSFERTRKMKIVRSSLPDAPKELVQRGEFDGGPLDELMVSHGHATAWLETLLAPLQWRNPAAEEHIGLLSLQGPRTLDEWRAARRILEARLGAVGFFTRQIGQLLPDGKGDSRRRVAMRRRRLAKAAVP